MTALDRAVMGYRTPNGPVPDINKSGHCHIQIGQLRPPNNSKKTRLLRLVGCKILFRVKLGLLSFSVPDERVDPINSERIVDCRDNPATPGNLSVDLDAVLTHWTAASARVSYP